MKLTNVETEAMCILFITGIYACCPLTQINKDYVTCYNYDPIGGARNVRKEGTGLPSPESPDLCIGLLKPGTKPKSNA